MTPTDLVNKVVGAVGNPRAALFKAALWFDRPSLLELVTARPRSFHEKLRFKMVRDRRAILADFADKATSRDYVTARVGRRYAMPTRAVLEVAGGLRSVDLRPPYVVKVSHASGGVIVVHEDADPQDRLPSPGGTHTRHRVRPDVVDRDALIDVIDAWLRRPFGPGRGEWAYTVHPPRVLVEEFVAGPGGAPPRDVKLFAFHGRVAFFRIDTPFGDTKRLDHFWTDGTPIPVRFGEYSGPLYPRSPTPPPLPASLQEMVRVAEALASHVDFVRVDFLELADGFVVSELTNYPTRGTGRFRPSRFDRVLGEGWEPASALGANDTSSSTPS